MTEQLAPSHAGGACEEQAHTEEQARIEEQAHTEEPTQPGTAQPHLYPVVRQTGEGTQARHCSLSARDKRGMVTAASWPEPGVPASQRPVLPLLAPPAWVGGGGPAISYHATAHRRPKLAPATHSSRTTSSPPHSAGATSRSVWENVH